MRLFSLSVTIAFAVTVLSLDCNIKQSFSGQNSEYPFPFISLPYPADFLSEGLPPDLVWTHSSNFQQLYVSGLNSYITTSQPRYKNTALSSIVYNRNYDIILAKYASGLYNHLLYWWTLTAPACSSPQPTGKLLKAIDATWGSYVNFLNDFEYQAINWFGNGWVWLCVNMTGKLEIMTTEFEINPMSGLANHLCYTVLGMDLWEHAYYEKYTTDRTSYITDFWNMVDWAIVEMFYDKFASQLSMVPL
jgi:superoxide dismutase, Fe-Mn family